MVLTPEVSKRIDDIRRDRHHGASWLSQQSLDTLKLGIERSQAEGIDLLLEEIKRIAVELIQARPGMAIVANSLCQLIYEVSIKAETEKDLNSLQDFALAKEADLIAWFRQTRSKTARHSLGCSGLPGILES